MPTGKDNGISEVPMEKPINGTQCKLARNGLGWSQDELAKAVGVSDRTIHGFEKSGEAAKRTKLAIRAVLEGQGARFLEREGYIGVLIPWALDDAA